MDTRKLLQKVRIRRKTRSRAKIFGTATLPRLSVFRSNKGLFVQLIDDAKGVTLGSVSMKELGAASKKKAKIEQAAEMGEKIAKKAEALGVKKAVFDRGAYQYHGRVRAVAEGARKAGLQI